MFPTMHPGDSPRKPRISRNLTLLAIVVPLALLPAACSGPNTRLANENSRLSARVSELENNLNACNAELTATQKQNAKVGE
jgi:outer membrane murein-binding lipoprotein Lpp